jgi:Bacteriocin-protection, YdeI or OmpD-Associated
MTSVRIPGGVAHDLPADLRVALASDAKALAAWQDITPLARNEWICWTISVKKMRQGGSMSKGCVRNSKKGCGGHAAGQAVRIDEFSAA